MDPDPDSDPQHWKNSLLYYEKPEVLNLESETMTEHYLSSKQGDTYCSSAFGYLILLCPHTTGLAPLSVLNSMAQHLHHTGYPFLWFSFILQSPTKKPQITS